MIKRLLITGYKAHELGIFNDNHPGVPIIKKAVENQMRALLDEGLEWVITSGQLGVETWSAEMVVELKKEFPHLKYSIITPFLEQEKNWNDQKKENYQRLISLADFHTSVTKKPYEAPWQFIEKNKFLIRNTDAMLIIYDEENEGSPKFIKKLAQNYAEKNNYPIISIDAYDLQVIADEERNDYI
ncbi:SLOG family protein [Psychrobacillus sp. NPDC093200]|uniref:SLOG family protein n=1 Tax=Psychrobacillus sp. NPDC093200 TaxID=3390656 RepID=UPI003D05304A